MCRRNEFLQHRSRGGLIRLGLNIDTQKLEPLLARVVLYALAELGVLVKGKLYSRQLPI